MDRFGRMEGRHWGSHNVDGGREEGIRGFGTCVQRALG